MFQDSPEKKTVAVYVKCRNAEATGNRLILTATSMYYMKLVYINVGGTTSTAPPDVTTEPTTGQSPFVTENIMRIAVSYSSEHREQVLDITRILKNKVITDDCPYPVFLDRDFQHEICRVNGLSYLQRIYRKARLVVVFLSPSYPESGFCRGEWRAIVERFLLCRNQDRQDEQLLLVKLGEYDMKVLNLTSEDFPVDGLIFNNEQIADIIEQRLKLVEELLKQNDKKQ